RSAHCRCQTTGRASGVSIGDGVVYIGNRGGSEVCAFNARTLARVAYQHLDSRPDGVAYVAATKEVWGTTPRAARAAKLTIARADAAGKLTTVAQVPTQNGARNGVVTKDGTIYLAHGGGVKLPALVVVSPSK